MFYEAVIKVSWCLLLCVLCLVRVWLLVFKVISGCVLSCVSWERFTMLTLWQDELEDQKEAIVKKDGAIADLERQLKDKDSHIGVRVFFFFVFSPFLKLISLWLVGVLVQKLEKCLNPSVFEFPCLIPKRNFNKKFSVCSELTGNLGIQE